ncbi:MAG: GntR family transcriptional regulator [Armatimonadetes bacterium]|nr:GntR family transcriptional regulator [Armatimonadota bacterium]
MELQRGSEIPLHQQLREALRLRVLSGEWPPGHRIPSEPELAETLGIARGTVRAALSELVRGGLLERRQGDGTYVARRSLEQELMGFYSFAREAKQRGVDLTSEVLEWRVGPAGEAVARRLALAPDEAVLRVTRVRMLEAEPVLVEACHLPAAPTRRLQEADFAKGALYDALERFCRIVVTRAEEMFEAVALGGYEAGLLDVAPGSPALRVERIAYAVGDRPVEWRISTIRGDRCRYRVRLGSHG